MATWARPGRRPRAASASDISADFGVRFYAGTPLTTVDGFRVGTLCVMDRRPRQLKPSDLQALKDMTVGHYVADLFGYRYDVRTDERGTITTVDGTGKYLLPGLVDLHVHLGYNPEPEQRALLEVCPAAQRVDELAAVGRDQVAGSTLAAVAVGVRSRKGGDLGHRQSSSWALEADT